MALTYRQTTGPRVTGIRKLGVCLFIHDKTGHVFIFSSKDIMGTIKRTYERIKDPSTKYVRLHELYREDPNFTAEYTLCSTESEVQPLLDFHLNRYEGSDLLTTSVQKRVNRPGAYLLTHYKTGKVYVGSTSNLDRRLTQDRFLLRKGTHLNKGLQEAHNTDSELTVKVVHTDTRQEALEVEQAYLDKYKNTGTLFNTDMTAHLSYQGNVDPEKRKEALRKAHLGKVVSEETRRLIGKSSRGRVYSKESRQKMREKALGRKVSEKSKEKIRQSKLGVPRSPETIAKIKKARQARS